jgi:hypothetical protein
MTKFTSPFFFLEEFVGMITRHDQLQKAEPFHPKSMTSANKNTVLQLNFMLVDQLNQLALHSFHWLENITSIKQCQNEAVGISMSDFMEKSPQIHLQQSPPPIGFKPKNMEK